MTTDSHPASAALQHKIENRLATAMRQYALGREEQQRRCDAEPNDPELGHLREQISAEAFLLAEQQLGPAPLIAALQAVGLNGLCPTAAEAHYHAVKQHNQDTLLSMLTESCAIFTHKKILFAAPTGCLDAAALQRVSDRILITLNRLKQSNIKCKKVTIILGGLESDATDQSHWLAFLKEDLHGLKISLETRHEGKNEENRG